MYAMGETARPSLFNTVTGAFRRRTMQQGVAPVLQPHAMRREPPSDDYQPEIARVSVRQTSAADETGIEIPAFLRRQSS